MLLTRPCALFLEGKAPTDSAMPKRLASLAWGIRNVRVIARGEPARAKSASSHVVAAMLGLAGTGCVPTHGWLIRPITGRSAAARVPGVSPEGGGSTGAARTPVGHGPDGSAVQTLRTASVSVVTARSTATGPRPRVSETVETVSDPVRARPTT